VAVFLPLTMVGGLAGIMFKQLGWIVSIVVVVSTLTAITLTPMLSAMMLKFKLQHSYKGLGKIFKPVDRFLEKLDNGYSRLLGWTVTNKWKTIISAALIFAVSLLLLLQVPTNFMPDTDNGRLQVQVDLPVNYNLDQTSAFAHKLESRFKELVPETEFISVSSGSDDQGGFAALFGNSGINSLEIGVMLIDKKDRHRSQNTIADVLREEVMKYPEVVKYTVGSGGGGAGMMGGNTVDVKVFGYDFNATAKVAKVIADSMKLIKGARDIKISREEMRVELHVDFDREKLAKFGINTATAATFVRNRINGMTASLYREDGEEYDIVVRYDEQFRASTEDLENIVLMNSSGQTVRLRDVAKVTEDFTPPIIEREDRQRVVTVSAALGAGVALGKVADGTKLVIKKLELPAGVDVAIAGSVEDQQESFSDLFTLLGLIILLVYIVMATQFESFTKPFIIMLSIPFAFTGVFLALWLTGTSLDLIALIGSIMLVGIVVKNGIVIVDFMNLQRERGMNMLDAVMSAGKSRLRPVLMTSLTTILGMLPLAMGTGEGSEIWQPMGIAVVGGLAFSTILTLLVIPAFYALFNEGAIKRERKDNRVEIEEN
jgi:HAE1 family hydrophobic/amphiphilic exporter-1